MVLPYNSTHDKDKNNYIPVAYQIAYIIIIIDGWSIRLLCYVYTCVFAIM